MALTFEDGIWFAVEFLGDFDDQCAKHLVKASAFSREQAIKLSKVSGNKPNLIKELDEMSTWKTKEVKGKAD